MDEATKVELERLRDEDKRQNHRLDILEENSKVIHDLAMSVHALAHDMSRMLEEQRSQGDRLDRLEAAPGKQWNHIKTTIITAIVSTIAGSMATGLIFILSQSIK